MAEQELFCTGAVILSQEIHNRMISLGFAENRLIDGGFLHRALVSRSWQYGTSAHEKWNNRQNVKYF